MSDSMSLPVGFGLKGKHVLITGAGGGIGRALVTMFRQVEARITGMDRDEAALGSVPLDHGFVFDLQDPAAVAAAIEACLAKAGCPDVVISNAGFTRGETLDQVDQAVWDAELAINLTGAYAMSRPLLRAMAARGGGAFVFVASVNAMAYYGNPAYSAAKAGLVALARAIAVERGRDGIRANVVCPGSVRTAAWDHRLAQNPALLDRVVPHYPLGRLVTPEEVARTVLFLASPLASGITGAVVPVDAGLTAGNTVFVNEVIEGR